MFVKRYIAKDMPEAMERIRRDLGPDAVILSNKPVRDKGVGGYFKKKLLEVVVAYEPMVIKNNGPMPPPKEEEAKKPPVDLEKIDRLNDKLAELQDVVKDFTDKIITVDKETRLKFSPEVTELYNRLAAHDVHEAVTKKIADQVQDILRKVDDAPEDVVSHLVREALGDPGYLRLKKYKTNVIMLVGPTGVGKTTTLVKLAGLYTVEYGLKVGFINTDTYRVAAQEQLKTYSEIMDIPLCTVYSPDEMDDALFTLSDRDVILIDTAGKSTSTEEYRKEIVSYMQKSGVDEILLAVSVTMGFGACREMLDHYAFLENYKYVITKLDEVSIWGNLLNIVSYMRKPIAFVTVGQNVPYDIEQPDMDKIANNILGSVIV